MNVAVSEVHGPKAITVTDSPAMLAVNVTVPDESFEVVPFENSTNTLSADVPAVDHDAVQSVAETVALAVSTDTEATGSGCT